MRPQVYLPKESGDMAYNHIDSNKQNRDADEKFTHFFRILDVTTITFSRQVFLILRFGLTFAFALTFTPLRFAIIYNFSNNNEIPLVLLSKFKIKCPKIHRSIISIVESQIFKSFKIHHSFTKQTPLPLPSLRNTNKRNY